MSVGVLSFGMFMGATGAFVGLVIGVIYGSILIVVSLAGAPQMQQQGVNMAAFGIGGGIALMIFAPIIYGVMMFVFGLIYAVVLNVALRLIGGLELEIRGPGV
jgi:hypothetical protein